MSTNKKKAEKLVKTIGIMTTLVFIGLSLVAKYKKKDSIYENEPDEKNPFYQKEVVFVQDDKDEENADGVKGHLKAVGDSQYKESFYGRYIKRIIDIFLSFWGLVFLSPIYAIIAIAIKIDDPGPVLFTQKRVGQNKQYFKLHKFRSMKMSTPHDVPTHMLDDPDQYITRVGKFLRKHSLDELPQVWDIFIGNMSVIGPRPALWNQDILTSERDKYHANDVKPGLTGWAQINGRDELEIPDKAKLDGDYVKDLGPAMDAKVFLKSLGVFGKDESVVEGGTGAMKEHKEIGRHFTDGKSGEELIGEIGFKEPVEVNRNQKKKVLITGAGSYIGETFHSYVTAHYAENFDIESVDMLDESWKNNDFSSFDIVYHVAGIAHADVGNVSDEVKEKYYKVNTDLAIEVCKKAKAEGVKEFIFMSSMIVYGDSAPFGVKKVIDEHIVPHAANFYGDSKLQADVAVRELADENFKVIVLRPPMIYGRGSKGNYPLLAKIAKTLPVFPDVENERSMLYIENLCEFLCQIMLVNNFDENSVVLIPQNAEWTKTSEMVKDIALVSGRKIHESKFWIGAVAAGGKVPGKIGGLVNKAFGNNAYKHELSVYDGIDYQKYGLEESIKNAENTITEESEKKKVLIVASVASMIDQFNKPNIELLQTLGYDVDVATNFVNPGTITDDKCAQLLSYLHDHDVDCYQIDFDRNVLDAAAIKKAYSELDQVFKGSAMPIASVDKNGKNIAYINRTHKATKYAFMHCHSPIGGVIGRLVAHKNNVVAIYTAHGFHFYDGAPLKNWLIFYPIEKALSRITNVLITINKEDYQRAKTKFHAKQVEYVPGIGIDTNKYSSCLVDKNTKKYEIGVPENAIVLLSVGELNTNKNHEVVIRALKQIDNKNVYYLVAGQGEAKGYLEKLSVELGVEKQVKLLGFRDDIPELLHVADIYILPSIREGLNVSLMEAMAAGLPCIAGDIRGNVDLIEQGKNGFLFKSTDVNSLSNVLNKMVNDENIRDSFGQESSKIIKKFDKSIVLADMEKIYTE